MTTIPAPTRGISTRDAGIPPATPTIDELYARTAEHVNQVTVLAGDVTDLEGRAVANHVATTELQLRTRAEVLGRQQVGELLDRLADIGLGWRQIAGLVGVSVPAVRKWRQGGAVTGPNRLRLAWLAALIEWMSEEKLIDDPASWLEMPLSSMAPVSRLDLLVARRDDLVIRCLTGSETAPESLLDEFDPEWRSRYESDFEVFTADDGLRSIRSKRAQG